MELRSVETVVKTLNEAGVEYIIVGGVAVNAHGFVRMTRDLDLVLRLNRENIITGLNSLLKIGYKMAIPVSIEDFASSEKRSLWMSEKNMIVLKLWSDSHSRTPIDIFISEPFDFYEEYLRIVQMELSPKLFAPVVSLETLLNMKRQADRPQDRIDIQELSRLL